MIAVERTGSAASFYERQQRRSPLRVKRGRLVAIKTYRAGDITIYKTAATFYIDIEPSAPYRRAGVRFTIIVPPRLGAAPPFDQWQRETWVSVRRVGADGRSRIEIELLQRAPLDEEQISFFEQLR